MVYFKQLSRHNTPKQYNHQLYIHKVTNQIPSLFRGRPEHCNGFLMQCKLFLHQQAHHFPFKEAMVSFLSSLLSGEAPECLSAIWFGGSIVFHSYEAFTRLLKFVHVEDGEEEAPPRNAEVNIHEFKSKNRILIG
uniref:Uncharacterized protein n=1 Tax=Oryzias latipes TaxID=8090 RepID=A0A3B3HMJ6_ORYLA